MVEPAELEARIRANIPGVEHLQLVDLTGTKDHYELTLVAACFEGTSRVAQHQTVYRALGDWMAGPIHALALHTHTPSAWAARGPRLTTA